VLNRRRLADDRHHAATRFLADAATAELADWGPLEEATGEPMQTAGLTLCRTASRR